MRRTIRLSMLLALLACLMLACAAIALRAFADEQLIAALFLIAACGSAFNAWLLWAGRHRW
jgi:hypothetical protein